MISYNHFIANCLKNEVINVVKINKTIKSEFIIFTNE